MAPRASKAQPNRSDTDPVDSKHNIAAIEEGQRVQFLSFVGSLQSQKKKVDLAKTAYDVERDAMNAIYNHAKAANFLRKDLAEMLVLMASPTRDVVSEEKKRRQYMSWLGLITAETLDLFADASPDEVKDKAHWSGMGYTAGMRDDEPRCPDECPPRFVTDWTEAWGLGNSLMKKAEEEAMMKIVPGREKLKVVETASAE